MLFSPEYFQILDIISATCAECCVLQAGGIIHWFVVAINICFSHGLCTYSKHVPFTMQNTRDLFCKINEGHQNSQKYSDN